MNYVYIFIILYVLMLIVDKLIFKKVKFFKIDEYNYLKKRFNLKNNKEIQKKVENVSSLINAFILAIVGTFSIIVNFPLYITLPISFVLLILLIYSCYGIYGNILKKSQNK